MKRFNLRGVARSRTYTSAEVANLLGVHIQTVRLWQSQGLEPIDDGRPILIYGQTLFDFLAARLRRRKRPCTTGQMYCCKCRQGRFPVSPIKLHFPNAKKLELVGQCRQCGTEMHRYGATKNLSALISQFDVSRTGNTDLSQSEQTPVNANNRQGDKNEED